MDNQEQQIFVCYSSCKNQQLQQSRKFQYIEFIARGSEGEVYLFKPIDWCYNVDQVAIKIQKHVNQQTQEFYEKLLEQQNILDQNGASEKSAIIKIYELCYTIQQELVIIMEIGGQDLYKYQKQNKELDFQKKEQICLQLAKALKQLHQLKYIHRDIKPENFVIVNNEFKLIDFGLTKSIDLIQMTMNVGSRIFQAPEVLIGDGHYTSSIDIWSLGCTFFELLANEQLLNVCTALEAQILISKHPEDQNYIYNRLEKLQISQAWKDLIKKMFHPLPNERLTSEEIVQKIQSFLSGENKTVTPQEQINFQPRFLTPNQNNCVNQSKNGIPSIQNGNPPIQNGNPQIQIVNPQMKNIFHPIQNANPQIKFQQPKPTTDITQNLALVTPNKSNENQIQSLQNQQLNNTSNNNKIQTLINQVPQNTNLFPQCQNKGFPPTFKEQQQQQPVFLTQQQDVQIKKFQTSNKNDNNNQSQDAKIQQLEQNNQQLSQKVESYEGDLLNAKNEIRDLQNQIGDFKSEIDDLKNGFGIFKNEIGYLRNGIMELKNQQQQLLDQNKKMKNLLKKQQQQQQASIDDLNEFLNQGKDQD